MKTTGSVSEQMWIDTGESKSIWGNWGKRKITCKTETQGGRGSQKQGLQLCLAQQSKPRTCSEGSVGMGREGAVCLGRKCMTIYHCRHRNEFCRVGLHKQGQWVFP